MLTRVTAGGKGWGGAGGRSRRAGRRPSECAAPRVRRSLECAAPASGRLSPPGPWPGTPPESPRVPQRPCLAEPEGEVQLLGVADRPVELEGRAGRRVGRLARGDLRRRDVRPGHAQAPPRTAAGARTPGPPAWPPAGASPPGRPRSASRTGCAATSPSESFAVSALCACARWCRPNTESMPVCRPWRSSAWFTARLVRASPSLGISAIFSANCLVQVGQFGPLHDPVDHPDLVRPPCAHPLTGEQELLRDARRHHPRVREVFDTRNPHPYDRVREEGVVRRHDQVAHPREHQPARHARPLHRRHHRLRQLAPAPAHPEVHLGLAGEAALRARLVRVVATTGGPPSARRGGGRRARGCRCRARRRSGRPSPPARSTLTSLLLRGPVEGRRPGRRSSRSSGRASAVTRAVEGDVRDRTAPLVQNGLGGGRIGRSGRVGRLGCHGEPSFPNKCLVG
ncbi:hypothetical protein SSPIM334S_00285 [Streptomyces spiroverticillatus]